MRMRWCCLLPWPGPAQILLWTDWLSPGTIQAGWKAFAGAQKAAAGLAGRGGGGWRPFPDGLRWLPLRRQCLTAPQAPHGDPAQGTASTSSQPRPKARAGPDEACPWPGPSDLGEGGLGPAVADLEGSLTQHTLLALSAQTQRPETPEAPDELTGMVVLEPAISPAPRHWVYAAEQHLCGPCSQASTAQPASPCCLHLPPPELPALQQGLRGRRSWGLWLPSPALSRAGPAGGR